MSFNPVIVDRFEPIYVESLSLLAWLAALAALTSLPRAVRLWRGGNEIRRARRTSLLASLGLLVIIVLCGVLTLIHHVRVTEPGVRKYLAAHPEATALRPAVTRTYKVDARNWALGFAAATFATAVRSRGAALAGGGA